MQKNVNEQHHSKSFLAPIFLILSFSAGANLGAVDFCEETLLGQLESNPQVRGLYRPDHFTRNDFEDRITYPLATAIAQFNSQILSPELLSKLRSAPEIWIITHMSQPFYADLISQLERSDPSRELPRLFLASNIFSIKDDRILPYLDAVLYSEGGDIPEGTEFRETLNNKRTIHLAGGFLQYCLRSTLHELFYSLRHSAKPFPRIIIHGDLSYGDPTEGISYWDSISNLGRFALREENAWSENISPETFDLAQFSAANTRALERLISDLENTYDTGFVLSRHDFDPLLYQVKLTFRLNDSDRELNVEFYP